MPEPAHTKPHDSQTPALEFHGVAYTYPAPRWGASKPDAAVEGVSFRVDQGERLGILGPNGGGKSTLLRLALGLIEPNAGHITVLGRTPSEARRAGLIRSVPQRVEANLAWPINARQAVVMGSAVAVKPWRKLPAGVFDAADRALDLVGATSIADSPVGTLSSGQLQRVMIARAIAAGPKLLLLDEPTVGVDVVGQRRFAELIDRLHSDLDLTIVTVSHDLRTVASGSDRVACLRRTLHFHAAPKGLTPAILAEVFAHDVEAVFGEIHIDAHRADECEDPAHQHTSHEGHDCCSDPSDPSTDCGGES